MKEVVNENIIKDCKIYINELFAGADKAHDILHTLRVFENAKQISKDLECDKDLVLMAALLHDADDKKLFNTENYANARRFLSKHFQMQFSDKVIQIIKEVSFSKHLPPATIESAIVQDADRLDAIGAIGIARTFTYGGAMGRAIYGDANGFDTLTHFYDKLFKLEKLMNTEPAKRIAKSRTRYMKTFVRRLKGEIHGE